MGVYNRGTFWLLFLLLGGCAHNDEPMLEEWVDGIYQSHTVTEYKVSGKRDGATTQVSIIFDLEGRERLKLELTVVYNPTPVLSSGHWSIDGSQTSSGVVKAESLTFLGGQGEGPSLGGRFQLYENSLADSPRFRVVVPLRPVNKPNW